LRGIAQWIVRALPAADAILLGGMLAVGLNRKIYDSGPASLFLILLTVPIAQGFFRRFGLYDSHRVDSPLDLARDVVVAHLGTAGIVVGLCLFLSGSVWRDLLIILSLSCILLTTAKTGVYVLLRILRSQGFDQRNVLLVGNWAQAEPFADHFRRRPEWGLRLDCVLTSESANLGSPARSACYAYPANELIGTNIEEVLQSRVIDEVVVPVQEDAPGHVFDEARRFAPYGLQVRVVFGQPGTAFARPRTEEFAGAASFDVVPPRLDPGSMAIKRIIDVVLSVGLLIIGSPIMAAIALLIRITSPGPILFRQTRVGLNGRHFKMRKFRTMIDGAEFQVKHLHRSITRGPVFKDVADYRITPLGRFLRRFSLDELPQLFNVLRGDMSLVGPRPLPVAEANQVTGEYRRRFSVLPGITCIWQVSGRSDVSYDRWMQYDLQYVDRWSLLFDAALLLRTIPAVLSRRGAY
jgi:exopolysaccharide biosynthesis polyprenyl glycosylphosphotransferase